MTQMDKPGIGNSGVLDTKPLQFPENLKVNETRVRNHRALEIQCLKIGESLQINETRIRNWCTSLNWAGDRVLTAEKVHGGSRRYLVALSLLLMAARFGTLRHAVFLVLLAVRVRRW